MSIWLPIVIVLSLIIGISLWAAIAGRHDGGNWEVDQSEYLAQEKDEEVDEA